MAERSQTKQALADQLEAKNIELERQSASLELFQERLADLELALEDSSWLRLEEFGRHEFSQWAQKRIKLASRMMYLKNPLIGNAVRIQSNYVWAQGVTISSKNDPINTLIQAFLDDRRNKREWTGSKARVEKEIELQVEGELFLVLFTNPSSGAVQIRTIMTDEITDVITDPDDRTDPWLYKRTWGQQSFDWETGNYESSSHVEYYPDWQYVNRPDRNQSYNVGGNPINWDSPIYHIKTGGFSWMKRGISETYPAQDWAKAVTKDLEDFATIKNALSRFAWSLTSKQGPKQISNTKARLASTVSSGNGVETNPPATAGSVWIQREGVDMQPMKTAGAQPSPDEGRRLWLMVGAALGIPETMLSGDTAGGSFATAKSLDRPTELEMMNRQRLWTQALQDILSYVVESSVRAPNGVLDGQIVADPYSGQEHVEVGSETVTIDVSFPPILSRDPLPTIQAITSANTFDGKQPLGVMPDRTIAKLVFRALGMADDESDEILNHLYPDQFAVGLDQKSVDLAVAKAPAAPPGQPGGTPGQTGTRGSGPQSRGENA